MLIILEIYKTEKAEQIYGDAVEQQLMLRTKLMTEDIKAQLLDWILPYYKTYLEKA